MKELLSQPHPLFQPKIRPEALLEHEIVSVKLAKRLTFGQRNLPGRPRLTRNSALLVGAAKSKWAQFYALFRIAFRKLAKLQSR